MFFCLRRSRFSPSIFFRNVFRRQFPPSPCMASMPPELFVPLSKTRCAEKTVEIDTKLVFMMLVKLPLFPIDLMAGTDLSARN